MDLILAIDDDIGMLRILERQLSKMGYDVVTTTSGKAGIEMARTCSPVLILLDIVMPVMDGFETLQALQQDPVSAGIPVVMVSSQSGKNIVINAMKLGVSDYIIKPYDIETLKQKVESAIGYSRMQKYAHQDNLYGRLEIKRGGCRTVVVFNSPLGLPGMVEEMRGAFNHGFLSMSSKDALVLDMRECGRFESEDAKVLSTIFSIFPSRKLYVIAGRYYGAVAASPEFVMPDRVSLYISQGDMEMEMEDE